jgi:hypothetical protein
MPSLRCQARAALAQSRLSPLCRRLPSLTRGRGGGQVAANIPTLHRRQFNSTKVTRQQHTLSHVLQLSHTLQLFRARVLAQYLAYAIALPPMLPDTRRAWVPPPPPQAPRTERAPLLRPSSRRPSPPPLLLLCSSPRGPRRARWRLVCEVNSNVASLFSAFRASGIRCHVGAGEEACRMIERLVVRRWRWRM